MTIQRPSYLSSVSKTTTSMDSKGSV